MSRTKNDTYADILSFIAIIIVSITGLLAGMFIYSEFFDMRPRDHKETICFVDKDSLTHCLDIEDYNEMIKNEKNSQ